MIELSDGRALRVIVDEGCGGTVRSIGMDGAELLVDPEFGDRAGRGRPSAPPEPCATRLFAGRFLVPFADRIPDGVYEWRGTRYRLAPNDATDAMHGFLYGTSMSVAERRGDRALLTARIGGVAGYPWLIDVSLRIVVADGGVRIDLGVTGAGMAVDAADGAPEVATAGAGSGVPAPVTVGWHPYFSHPAGAATIDTALLEVPADRYLEADERLRLTGRRPDVDGTPYDFRRPRPIGEGEIDIALESRGAAPSRRVALFGGGAAVHIESGGAFRRTQLFVPPGREGIAIEPVSAPAAAFSDPSLGVAALAPGDRLDAWVTITRVALR